MVKIKIELHKESLDRIDKSLERFDKLIDSFNRMATPPPTPTSSLTYAPYPPEPVTDEEKATVEDWLKTVDPIIQQEAISMLKQEVRDMVLMGGNAKAISKALKEGKKPKLVRKKIGKRDPLFLQIGDGVDEPIEEFHIFG